MELEKIKVGKKYIDTIFSKIRDVTILCTHKNEQEAFFRMVCPGENGDGMSRTHNRIECERYVILHPDENYTEDTDVRKEITSLVIRYGADKVMLDEAVDSIIELTKVSSKSDIKTATDFLRSKGMLSQGYNNFFVRGTFGEVSLNTLLNEYAQILIGIEKEKTEVELISKFNEGALAALSMAQETYNLSAKAVDAIEQELLNK